MEYDYIECGDCLELMKEIPDGSVDLVLTDPPYGKTDCKWDNVIPFEPMWEQLNRIIKPNGAIVLFGSEPFSSALRMSNIKNYKYDLVWDKVNRYTGTLLAGKRPLLRHENIMVFYKKQPTYNKQYRNGKAYKMTHNTLGVGEYATNKITRKTTFNDGKHNPCSIIQIKGISPDTGRNSVHPTQKPIELMEYLIKTYTNEDETVLDFTMGSGSTCVACVNTNRHYIGFELDPQYYDIACKRLDEAEGVENGTV